MTRRILELLALFAIALAVGSWPGSALRGLAFVLTAPPLPEATADRDGALVVAAKDDAGIVVAGANVQAFAMIDGKAYAAGAGRTDAAGRATLRGLPRGEHWVLVDAMGRARASSQLVLVGGERVLDVVLRPEHVVTVEVKDEQGAPLAGAEIEVSGAEPLPIGARARADGAARVGRLGPPPWQVTARAVGYEEVVQRAVRESGVRVTLRRLGALLVEVRGEDGAPAASAHVFVAGPTLWPPRVAEVKGGKVRIGALPAGAYALRATSGDLVSPVELSVPLTRGEEKPVVLNLAPGVRVSVRAVSEDGEAVAGARVILAESGVSPFPLEAATDRTGRATLGPIARGPASLSATADGFVPRGAVALPEPLTREVTLTLAKAGALIGRVVDTRGFPVDGASLVVVGTDFSGAPIDEDPRRARFRDAHFAATLRGPAPLLPMGELGVMPGPVPPIPRAVSAAPLPIAASLAPSLAPVAAPPEPWVTRGDGTFRAAPVSPGRVRVLVRHPQFTDALSEPVTLRSGGEATIDVVMRRGGTLEGRVVDARGQPVAGAHVTFAAVRGSMERGTRTASDGTFAFASVPEDLAVAVARDGDLEPVARVATSVPEGEKRTLTITLPEPRPALDARVTDDRGYPVPAAQLSAQSLDPAAPLRVTAFTSARGEAQLPGARGVPLRVEVRAPGLAPRVVTVDAAAAGLLVVMQPAESARGEVRAASGRGDAIAGAEIVVYTDLGARHAMTDRDGAFTLADLAAGPARMRVRAAGFAPKELTITIDARGGGRPTELPRIELGGEGVVEGTVVDAHGDPVQGARIAKDRVPVYLAVGASPVGVAVTDARGRFRLAELAEGHCTLEIYAPDIGRTRLEGVRVVSGRTADAGRLTLRKDGAGEAAPAPGARGGVAITLGETNDREVVLVSVAEASEAERAGLAPGDFLEEIDGAKVATIAEARAKLNGAVGDDVVLRLRRDGRGLALRVTREEVRR